MLQCVTENFIADPTKELQTHSKNNASKREVFNQKEISALKQGSL